jgi:hypothetical protein
MLVAMWIIVFWDNFMVPLKMEAAGPSETMVTFYLGSAVAQAVSRWLPTAATFASGQQCGVCGGQSSTGAGFLRVLRFPLPITPPISPSS